METLYKIILINNLSKQEYKYTDIYNIGNIDSIYYSFNIDVSNLIDGEYTLKLFDNQDNYITSEIVRIGEYTNTNKQYNNITKYNVYNG